MPDPDTLPPQKTRVKILVVDDSVSVVAGIRQFLSSQPGLTVVSTALDGRGAIDATREFEPDLVVMDVRMPQLDGLKSTTRIRREFPAIKIILTSIDQSPDLKNESLQAGADAFLPKIGLQRNLTAEIHRLFPDRFSEPP